MADRGPHSDACAKAEPGSVCDCDCAGTRHAVSRTANGVANAGRVTARAARAGRAAGITPAASSSRADGVQVRAAERPRRFPPTVTERARAVRESMPSTADEWDALVPRHPSANDGRRARIADLEARAAAVRAEREQFVARMDAVLRDSGVPGTRRSDSRRRYIENTYLDYQRMTEQIEWAERDIAADRDRIAENNVYDNDRVPALPVDASGARMPTAEHQQRLTDMMAVGHEALASARAEFDRDPEIRRLTELRDQWAEVTRLRAAANQAGLDGDRERDDRLFRQAETIRDAMGRNAPRPGQIDRLIAARQHTIVRDMLADARPMGGVRHNVQLPDGDPAFRRGETGGYTGPAPGNAEQRIRAAEGYFPRDWLDRSAARPLAITSSDRAYYRDSGDTGGVLAMDGQGRLAYDGGFPDYGNEVDVHELGHRMEASVPGLREMEWTLVRRRSTGADGNLEPAQRLGALTDNPNYADHEVAYPDDWEGPYAGKTYEQRGAQRPDVQSWELFQVGLQDTYGRSSRRYDRRDDLQAFTLGALLTLGRR